MEVASRKPDSSEDLNLSERQIDLVHVCAILWSRKWTIVAFTFCFAVMGAVYSLMATEWYRAEVLLAPSDREMGSDIPVQLGGLARLAGLSPGRNSNAEAIAILTSRDFTRSFIQDRNLLPVLYPDAWDSSAKSWKTNDPDEIPDVRDAVELFDESVRDVREDASTGLVTVTIEWTDPQIAADWANLLVVRLNERMRREALAESEANMKYLTEQLAATSVFSLQQTISSLLESELQKAMLARGNEEFAFRIIDKAEPPKRRSKPKRTLTVVLSAIVGGLLGALIVLFRYVRVSREVSTR